MTTSVTGVKMCANCGAALQGRFCAACGQENRRLDPTVGDIVRELAQELSALDGRIIRSVRRLFFSPGFLTREHFAGRRAAWVTPIRLYLTLSLAFFAVASLTGTSPLSLNLQFTSSGGDDPAEALKAIGFASEEELRIAVNRALETWIPRAMFVLVPLFAWFVARVRREAGRNYPHYLIFALHFFAAVFGVQAIAVGIGYLSGSRIVAATLGIASVLYVLIYMSVALKTVYGGTTARAVMHTLVIAVLYWIATVVTAVIVLVPVLFWR